VECDFNTARFFSLNRSIPLVFFRYLRRDYWNITILIHNNKLFTADEGDHIIKINTTEEGL